MLMMFWDDMPKVPLEQTCPLNKDDLLIIMDKDFGIGLSNIQNESEQFFTIKSIMQKEESVFACTDFEKRCEQFSNILDTRLERYFDTKRSKYIFFDEEEQMYIRSIFKKNKLNCVVKLYIREDEEDTFKEIAFEEIGSYEYSQDPLLMKVKKALRKLNVKYVISPDRYIELKQKREKRARDFKQRFERKKKDIELREIRKFFEKYPGLSEIESEAGFKSLYRNLAKKYHADTEGSDEQFLEMKSDFDEIKETIWYKNLGKPAEAKVEVEAETTNKEVSISAKQTVFDKMCENKKGKIYKLFRAMVEKK